MGRGVCGEVCTDQRTATHPPPTTLCAAYVTVWWCLTESWFVADGQDVNAEGVNAYKRVPLYANYGEAFLNPSVSVDSLEKAW